MEQTIKIMRADVGNDWINPAKASVMAALRWIAMLVRAVITAMFVPSEADRQIEESRERARRYLMRS